MRYKAVIYLTAITILFSGCAYHIEYVAEPEKGVYTDYAILNNSRYIPLIKYCAYYDLDWRWDAVAQTIEVSNSRGAAVFRTGSRTYVANGTTKYLEKPVELHESVLYIPLDSAKYLTAKVFGVGKIPAVPAFYSINRVVIDPGHGGKDPGALGQGVKEKDTVFDIAKRLRTILQGSGIDVVMTRYDDTFIPLQRRSEIANTKDAQLFVSIHANASKSSRAKGFEVYFLSEANDDVARAAEAAENAAFIFEKGAVYAGSKSVNPTVWDLELSESRRESKLLAYYICDIAAKELSLKDRGVKSARFYVLKGTRIPAVLIEVGFLTNSTELAKLKESSYREQLARAIAKGILVYKKEFEKEDGFTR